MDSDQWQSVVTFVDHDREFYFVCHLVRSLLLLGDQEDMGWSPFQILGDKFPAHLLWISGPQRLFPVSVAHSSHDARLSHLDEPAVLFYMDAYRLSAPSEKVLCTYLNRTVKIFKGFSLLTPVSEKAPEFIWSTILNRTSKRTS